jgi:hypothetical protein
MTTDKELLEKAVEDAEEGVELLDSLSRSIRTHGNYSQEATLLFLSHIRQCCTDTLDSVRAAAAQGERR